MNATCSQPSAVAWNAGGYAANSAVQLAWARELIARLSLRGDEQVLDVGCGDGKITAEIARALPRGSATGTDVAPEMIAFAQQTFPAAVIPNVKYLVADARQLAAVDAVGNRFEVVFSNAALHWVDDHPAFFRGAATVLKTGGRLAVFSGGLGNAWDVFLALRPEMRAPRWREYFRHLARPYFFYPTTAYESWLPQSGFRLQRLELVPKDTWYDGVDGFATWLRVTWLPYVQRVPEDLREEFITAVTRRYLAVHPADEQGRVHVRMMRLEIAAIKI